MQVGSLAVEMFDACAVAALVAAAIGLAIALGNVRVAKFVAIVNLRTAMVAVVLPRAFDTVVKSVTSHLIELRRWSLPSSFLDIARGERRAFAGQGQRPRVCGCKAHTSERSGCRNCHKCFHSFSPHF